MFTLPGLLRDRERPVTVGVVGAGTSGTRCLCQLPHVPGLAVSGVADADRSRARAALSQAGVPVESVVETADVDATNDTVGAGRPALVADGDTLARADIDVLVEATGEPVAGACHAHRALSTARTSSRRPSRPARRSVRYSPTSPNHGDWSTPPPTATSQR